MSVVLKINGRAIGSNHAPYVVAELSANHNGSLDKALAIMEAAKVAGANAIKLQTYTADTITIDHDSADFQLTKGPWAGRSLYELYDWAHTPWEWHETLFEKGSDLGITVFSSPFDKTAVDFLERFNPPAYKISSFELVDLPLIEYAASTGKPLFMSTGMATKREIGEAVQAAYHGGAKGLCLLHCVSGYPTPPEEVNLRAITELGREFDVIPGLSDHTLGTEVAVGAVALGACVVEKHLTLSRDEETPDSKFSLEPDELKQLVQSVSNVYKALGEIRPGIQLSESSQQFLRRSLYAISDIKANDLFTESNVRSIRPGFGLSPRELPTIIGRKAQTDIKRGTPISWELVSLSTGNH